MEVKSSFSADECWENHTTDKEMDARPTLLGEDHSKNGNAHPVSVDTDRTSFMEGTSGSSSHKSPQDHIRPATVNGVSSAMNDAPMPPVVAPSTIGLTTAMNIGTEMNSRQEHAANNGLDCSATVVPTSVSNGTRPCTAADSSGTVTEINTTAAQPGTLFASKPDSLPMSLNKASLMKSDVKLEQGVNTAILLKNIPPDEQQRLLRDQTLLDSSNTSNGIVADPQLFSVGARAAPNVAPALSLNFVAAAVAAGQSIPRHPGLDPALLQRLATLQAQQQQQLASFVSFNSRQPAIGSATYPSATGAPFNTLPLHPHPFVMPHMAAVEGDQTMNPFQLPIQGRRVLAPKPPGTRPRGRPPTSVAALPTSQPPPIAPAPSTSSLFSFQQQLNMLSQAMAYQAECPILPPGPQAAMMAHAAGDTSAQIVSAETGQVPGRQRKPCNCSKSQCLKLYCECFANGEFCSNCNCQNCHNNIEHEAARSTAIRACLDRNPQAFRPKIGNGRQGEQERRHTKGCHCRRSGCLKNYCECYEAKIPCSNLCKCVGCKNFEGSAERNTLLHLAQAAEVRTQQQIAARNYLSSQIQEAVPRPPLHPLSGERLPYTMLTDEAASAFCNCLLERASDSESLGRATVATEVDVLEELNLCLRTLIKKAGYKGNT